MRRGASDGSYTLRFVQSCASCADHVQQTFRYNAGFIDKFGGESWPQEDGFLKIVRNEPLGVTAGIVPCNCFILKPSEKTPFSSLALGTLIKEAGFPPGVFQILSGDGSTGALIASHMRIRKVSFTGR
jgi:aldehyde dehydrogenase (NAD+)